MMLDIDKLSFSYDGKKNIFTDVSFSLDKGDILSILGANGSGKSTLLNCISLILRANNGSIKLNGENLLDINHKEISKKIGYVQQIHIPTYSYKVRDYIAMGRSPYLNLFERPRFKDYEIVDDVIKLLEIEYLKDKPYTQISGGERQKANIARVIVQEPDIIMLDEPTAHLDYGNQINTLKLIKKLSDEGYIVIHTTHNPNHTLLLKNYAGILNEGKFTFGKSEKLITEDNLEEIYNIDIKIIHSKEVKREICTIEEF